MRRHVGRDPWGRDSYDIPKYAVVGSSDCGDAPDSPAPTSRVIAELNRFRLDLRAAGIKSKFAEPTPSGNLFMVNRWVKVAREDFPAAIRFADKWLREHRRDTHYIHDEDDAVVKSILESEVTT